MNMTITGDRILLRPLASYEEYHAWRELEAGMPAPYWPPQPRPGILDRGAFMATGLIMDERGVLAMQELATGRQIGCMFYSSRDGFMASAEVGTRIHPERQGRGFGVEGKRLMAGWLFGNFPIRLVYAMTIAGHSAAVRSMELAGFARCGLKPVDEFSRGSWKASVIHSMTRQQWNKERLQ